LFDGATLEGWSIADGPESAFHVHEGGITAFVVNKLGETEQRRRDRVRRGIGTEAELAGQPWWHRTERRTETGTSSKDYGNMQGRGVNKQTGKSVEGRIWLADAAGAGICSLSSNAKSGWQASSSASSSVIST